MTKESLMKKLLVFTLVAAFAGFAWLLLPGPDQVRTSGAPQKTTIGSGLVQSIDKERGVVTIEHGPLPALGMMAMTMSYVIKDKSQLANLRPLQKVEFELSYDGNNYLITEIK